MSLLVTLLFSAVPGFAQTPAGTLGALGPTGLAIDTVGGSTFLYVPEFNGGKIVAYNLTTGSTTPVVVGPASGTFTNPNGILIEPTSRDLLITDRGQNRVLRMTNTGTVVWTYGSAGSAAGQFQGPIGIARDSTGAIYVTEHDGVRVQKFTLGASGLVPVTTGWPVTGFTAAAYAVAFDSSNNVYVGDRSGTIKKYSSAGAALPAGNITTGRIVTGISGGGTGPFYTTQTSDGPSGNRVQRFPAGATTADLTFGADGTGTGQFNTAFSVVVNPATNRAYVADFGNDRVQIWDLNPPPAGDTTAPTVAVTNGATSATTVTFNVAFSENVTGVTSSVFTATGGGGVTASPLTAGSVTGSGANYVVTVGYSGSGGSVVLSLNGTANTSVRDASNNFYAGAATSGSANTSTQTIAATGGGDTTRPRVTSFELDIPNATLTAASMIVTFNEAVTGVDANDFDFRFTGSVGATVTTVTAGSAPNSYNVNFSYSGTGSIQMGIKSSGTAIADAASNPFLGEGAAATPTYSVNNGAPADTTLPAISSFTAPGTVSASPVNLTLTFAEAVTGVSAGDFVASSNANVGTPTGSGTTWNIPVTYTGTSAVQVTVVGGATADIRDATGNWFAGGTTNGSVSFTPGSSGGTAPTIAAQSTSGTVGTAMTYQVVATGATSFSTTSTLPAGLSLSSAGVISGTPTAATPTGGTVVNVTATNATGSNSAAVTITIAAAPPAGSAPTIANQTVTRTQNAAFSYQVVATGATSFSIVGTPVLPAGLSMSSSGLITGTPTATGTTNVTVRATNSTGSTNATLTITINPAPPTVDTTAPVATSFVKSSNTASTVTFSLVFSESVTGVNSTDFTVTGSGTVTIPTTGVTGSGTTYTVVANYTGTVSFYLILKNSGTGIADAAGNLLVSGAASGTFSNATGTPPPPSGGGGGGIVFFPPPVTKQGQTLTFVSPVSALLVNNPVALSATASSGLPVTFTIATGNASVSGNMLTLRDTNLVVVRAIQDGNGTYNAASADITVRAAKGLQSINFPSMANRVTSDSTITLNAASSVGLPITYTLVSGPATLSGNVLTLTGAPGTVVVRATQSGSDSFNSAVEVIRSFSVLAAGQQVFFGKLGSDDFATAVSKDNNKGVFIARLASTGEAIVIRFNINVDGSFSATSRSMSPSSADVQLADAPATAAAARDLTLSGTVSNGVLTGSIAELDTSFTANVQPATGSTSSLAGLYIANVPGSATGDTYIVVGPSGQAYALAVTSAGIASGMGTVNADGAVNVTLSQNGSIAATLDVAEAALTGKVTAAGVTRDIVGLSNSAQRTDRMVNLSSRLRVTGGDASRSVIAGFVITGSTSKPVLVRAIGPGLRGFGVSDALDNPRLQLFDSTGKAIAENDDWNGTSDISTTGDRVGAFKLTAGSRDSAIVATLPPGGYTAVVTGVNGNGVALIEVYDAATSEQLSTQQLVNISTRGFVDTGDGNLIAGFVVTGNAPKRVLIRGIGAGLSAFGVTGVLADPMLRIYTAGNANAIAENDNWQTAVGSEMASATDIIAAAMATGAFPLSATNDAAIVITLMPGNYSAVVSGKNNSTGAGLVEVYEIPNP
ncbi:MAG: hypothetical protein Q7S40_25720 [Opitutaceae bacterium]|nr:hypothetical protein [Opitutaceae bacterium]